MNVAIRENRADGQALVRIAREVRAVVIGECCACRDRVPRHAIEGCDPPQYVHWYPGSKGAESTCAPCLSDVEQTVLDDLDKVAEIGAWLACSTPIVLPFEGGLLSGNVGCLTAAAVFTGSAV